MSEIISIDDLWFYYGDKLVLKEIDFHLEENDFLGIIGPNGGGKTTLLKIMLGLLKPSKGRISIFGDAPDRARKYISYLAQKNLFEQEFPINVLDVVLMGKYEGFFKKWSMMDRKEALTAFEKVGMLDYKNVLIGKLSGGQQQRVFLARALVKNPKILILDEPTAGVDSKVQKSFYDILENLNKDMTIILVSHDISVISSYVKKIACLNQELYYHDSKELKEEDLQKVYQCPVEMIAHGVSHRILKEH